MGHSIRNTSYHNWYIKNDLNVVYKYLVTKKVRKHFFVFGLFHIITTLKLILKSY